MYIRLSKGNTSKFTKVYLVEGYRDENGKSKQRIVKSYGNLEELEAKDPNILQKLKDEAKNMTKNQVNITLNLNSSNDDMEVDQNYGYFFLERLYEDLEISNFFKNKMNNKKYVFDVDQVFKLLLYSRILNPASKKATVENRNQFFEPFDVTLDSVYETLSLMKEIKGDLQLHLHRKITETQGRDTSLIFFDVTNYYFETEIENELKKVGVSKEKKRTHIVQMSLAIDQEGLPVGYELFSGNTHDSTMLIPSMIDMKERYKMGRVILTADKALNSGKNLAFLVSNGDGYIVSQKVRGSSKAFINKILEDDGYVYNDSKTFKIKSFLRERSTKDENGNDVLLKEKVVAFWSQDFDSREKHKRELLEDKINEYLTNPSKYKASNRHGIKKYLKEIEVDTITGEVEDKKTILKFEQDKYERDVALDGYYALVTSEIDMPDSDIIERYRGLWRIEDSFRVLKSDLEGRPVYVRREDRIEGHFLLCFVALLMTRLLENKLCNKYSIRKIQEALKNATCRKITSGIYSLNKQDDVFRTLENAYDVSLNYKNVRIEQIRLYRKEIVHNVKN
ncbi:IS1634 family transposase [Serpentinicella alkaliphila]|uniref:DDE family transposase n=1 Tax=Serpentinicella alkaliphila TaxID=1734049 RepID=A0A4R2UH21_9FIRM|nr:IS1634 family transposase [Serpentinicella alkaliphila]QUH25241.1 IS1634 family transposase [Serpentinicella alkaliphila]TCQ07053.1 DDE family transposase [Serpentinicella alkaliphila]